VQGEKGEERREGSSKRPRKRQQVTEIVAEGTEGTGQGGGRQG
jgi:hypothetical protein